MATVASYDRGIVAVGPLLARRTIVGTTPMTTIDELKNTGLKATVPAPENSEMFQRAHQRHMTAEDVFRVFAGGAFRMSGWRRCTAY